MLGTSVGPMLADPNGRKALEGINLATPFTLIPYMPLRSFSYTLPTGQAPDERLLRFNTRFSGDELLNLYTQAHKRPPMSLGVNLQWGYDPTSDTLRVIGADATFSLVPGLSITGGAYSDILRPPNILQNAEGHTIESKQSIPENPKPQAFPDVRIMVNIDLMKFNSGDFLRQIGVR